MSFCRVEGAWNVCLPSPDAPNQSTSPVVPAVTTEVADFHTVSAPGTNKRLAEATQSVAASRVLLAIWNDSLTAAPAYANATAGALYRGVVRATPAPSSSPMPAPAAPRATVAPSAERLAAPFGLGAGLFLCAAGGAMAGYDRLRSRPAPQPPIPSDPDDVGEEIDEPCEEIDD